MSAIKKTKKKLTPRTAKTGEQLCALRRDNLSTDGFWILVEEDCVHLHAQRSGEKSTAAITIPKRDFNRFVDFYNG